MRDDIIDILKSKQKERLIQNNPLFETITDYIIYTVFVGVCLVISFFFFEMILKNENIIITSAIFLLTLILTGHLIYSIIHLDRLTRIEGKDRQINRQVVEKLSNLLDYRLIKHNQNVSILIPPWNWKSNNWGRRVVIVFDEKDILINSTTYGMHGIKSPFHWVKNREIEELIIDEFKNEIE